MESAIDHLNNLATFRKFMERLPVAWQEFLHRRQLRLTQQQRNVIAPEKVAENIAEDFFTIALDWSLSDLNNQLKYADIVLTKQGIKRLLVEVKRPGSLKWDQRSLELALRQAWTYADEQRVRSIAVTDGVLFYAADILHGAPTDRTRLYLDAPQFSPDAWWVSVDGIYRPAMRLVAPELSAPGASAIPIGNSSTSLLSSSSMLLHPRYNVPAQCFAYVGDASRPSTWKLPCRHSDGSVDENHLPGAIRAILSNYRGTHIKTIPEAAIGDVLVRLGKAAAEVRKLPGQTPAPLRSYRQLYDALHQLHRLNEVLPT